MPDLYDPYRAYDESDPVDLEDAGGFGGGAVVLALAVLVVPMAAGIRVYDWVQARRAQAKR